MSYKLKKLLPSGMGLTAAAATLALCLALPTAQAHNSASHRGHHCSCDKEASAPSKVGTKKGASQKAKIKAHQKMSTLKSRRKLARVHTSIPVRLAPEIPDRFRHSPAPDYIRIIPEPTCNMEPAFAVPSCQARLKAAGQN
jgi:hypothetical protein